MAYLLSHGRALGSAKGSLAVGKGLADRTEGQSHCLPDLRVTVQLRRCEVRVRALETPRVCAGFSDAAMIRRLDDMPRG